MDLTYDIRCPFGNDWRIDRRIGKGSYGEVYLISKNAEGSHTQDQSAMKIIRIPANENEPRMLMDRYGWTLDKVRDKYAAMVSAAQDEIDILRKFKAESHIVSYEDYKIIEHKSGIGADLYLKMELLTPLEQWIASRDLKYEHIIRLGIEICEALELCENEGIIHGDIKTDNILVNQRDSFKLGDFGIAKNLSFENKVGDFPQGSLNYLAPEVFHKRRADQRADIYSLGMVLYRLLNDKQIPFLPQSSIENMEIDARQRRFDGEELPPPKHCFPALWSVIQKACAYIPERRYQRPADLKQALYAVCQMPEAKEEVIITGIQSQSRATESSTKTPDLAGDITPGRTPTGDWARGNTPENNSVINTNENEDTEEDEDNEDDNNVNTWLTPRIKRIIGVAIVCCVAIIGLLLIPKKSVPTTEINSDSGESVGNIGIQCVPGPFSAEVTLTGGKAPYELSIKCGESELSKITSKQKHIAIESLAPKTHYIITVVDSQGGQGSVEMNTTECAFYSGESFRVTNMRLYECDRLDLQGTSFEALSETEERRIRSISDGDLKLRNAIAEAQEVCYFATIQIAPGTEKKEIKGVLVLRTNDSDTGIVVSEEIVIPAQKTWAVYPLESLLSQVYTAYKGWPIGASTLELYTEDQFITEIPVTLQIKNAE